MKQRLVWNLDRRLHSYATFKDGNARMNLSNHAAEEVTRRLYDGMKWTWGSRTRSQLPNKGMLFLRNSERSLADYSKRSRAVFEEIRR